MYTSNQRPLAAPRCRSEHDFAQTREAWEAAVFDRAEYFSVCEIRNDRRRTEFDAPRAAVEFARTRPADVGACLYAVAATGRSIFLDPEKWDEWVTRWEGAQ